MKLIEFLSIYKFNSPLTVKTLRSYRADKQFNVTVGCARTNVIGSRTSFVIAFFVLVYIEIYIFRDNPFQAHSIEESYHPTQPFRVYSVAAVLKLQFVLHVMLFCAVKVLCLLLLLLLLLELYVVL